jgi:hypothetical protein
MPDPLQLEEADAHPLAEEPAVQIDSMVALLPLRVRERARNILSQGDAKSVQLLSRVIAKEHAKRRSQAKAILLLASLLLVVSIVAVTTHIRSLSGHSVMLGLGGFTLLALFAWTRLPTRLEKKARKFLKQSAEPGSIGPLLERLQLWAPLLRADARENLLRALPQITPEAFRKLTPTQQSHLYGTLNFEQRDRDRHLRMSVLTALGMAGDIGCLGIVYQLSTGEAVTDTAVAVREAARRCLDALFARLDFGPLEHLPRYLLGVEDEIRSEKTAFQDYATSLLGLRQLLPQLTPSDYRGILSTAQRSVLYGLPMLYSVSASGRYQFRRRDLHLEIVRTAVRLGDIRALDPLQSFVCTTMAAADEELYGALCQASSTLEALAEQKHADKVQRNAAATAASQTAQGHRPVSPARASVVQDTFLHAVVVQPPNRLPVSTETSEFVRPRSGADAEEPVQPGVKL